MPPGFHAELAAATLALFAGRPVLGDGFLKDLAIAAAPSASAGPGERRLPGTEPSSLPDPDARLRPDGPHRP